MKREEFVALSGTDKLIAIWDLLQQIQAAPAAGSSADAIGDGRPPKYDQSITRKGGTVQYASECSAKELQFWITQKKKPGDPQYAEKNAQQVKALGYWLAYRLAHPTEQWEGLRNKINVIAEPPSDKPKQYARTAPTGRSAAPAEPTPSFDDDEIPF